MAIHKLPEVTAEQENYRSVDLMTGKPATATTRFVTSKRDGVEPVPVGTYVAMVFEVVGYDPDCDGSLMARLRHCDRHGESTGWEPTHLGLYTDTDVVLDGPGDLHALIEEGEDAT
jgi:hypothetical protein